MEKLREMQLEMLKGPYDQKAWDSLSLKVFTMMSSMMQNDKNKMESALLEYPEMKEIFSNPEGTFLKDKEGEVLIDQIIPDLEIYDENNTKTTLHQVFSKDKLNLKEIEEIADKFSDISSFHHVYIIEAHAFDSYWPMLESSNKGLCIKKPKTVEERVQIAQTMKKDFNVRHNILVDDPKDDHINHFFKARPEKIFVIKHDGKDFRLLMKTRMGPFGYFPLQLNHFLSSQKK